MWIPFALEIDFRCVFRPGRALNTARARYLSNMGHFCAMWITFALEIDFRCFFDLGELSTLRARAVLEQHGPCLCYVDSIRSGDRFFIFV
jgi:hypothetical protein